MVKECHFKPLKCGCSISKFVAGGKAVVKSIMISVALVVINAYVNWFILLQLTKHEKLNTNLISIESFRIVIALCQVAGSVLCLIMVDFIGRKVHKSFLFSSMIANDLFLFTVFVADIDSWNNFCSSFSNSI